MNLYVYEIFITIPIREGGRKNFSALVNNTSVYFHKFREEKQNNEYVEYFFAQVPRWRVKAAEYVEIIFNKSILGKTKIVLPYLPPQKPLTCVDLREPAKDEYVVNTYIYPNRYFTISVYIEAK